MVSFSHLTYLDVISATVLPWETFNTENDEFSLKLLNFTDQWEALLQMINKIMKISQKDAILIKKFRLLKGYKGCLLNEFGNRQVLRV